jgi:hypothetical protein
MPEGQRLRAILEDAQFSEAVIHAAPALSGLSAEMHNRVTEAALNQNFGAQIRGIKAREEMIATVSSALAVAAMQYRNVAGLEQGEI